MHLRYGPNPHLPSASAEPVSGRPPFRVLHGTPSYINLLDALGGWRLVREASDLFGRPAATSIKHVSPAGAALAGPLDPTMRETFGLDTEPASAVTRAYVRARDADPKSSYGDFVAVSAPVDAELAALLRRVVSDGIIAPAYEPGTVDTLAAKKGGRFLILEADPSFVPPAGRSARSTGSALRTKATGWRSRGRSYGPLLMGRLCPTEPPTTSHWG